MDRFSELFFDDKPNDDHEYIQVYGRQDNKRVLKWFCSDYVTHPTVLDRFTVLIAKANGNGTFGEILTQPIIAKPFVASTETFISIGSFEDYTEAETVLKYVKTKFARAMLGILKVTQLCTPEAWAKVPLQDFTDKSDIDWSKSVAEIDQQLYEKYNLNQEEIDFIESKVKSME